MIIVRRTRAPTNDDVTYLANVTNLCTRRHADWVYCNIFGRLFYVYCHVYTFIQSWACARQKTTKWSVRPAKTQISLGIRPVWSESSQSAWRRIGTLATHWAYSEVSDLSRLMPRLNWDFAGRTCHLFLSFFWFCRAAAQIVYCKYLVLSLS